MQKTAKRKDLHQLLILSDKRDTLKKVSTDVFVQNIPIEMNRNNFKAVMSQAGNILHMHWGCLEMDPEASEEFTNCHITFE